MSWPSGSGPTNPASTEIVEIKGRGHALTIDHGWREVADTALAFVQRLT
jgi:non-heme chloroperoxidase